MILNKRNPETLETLWGLIRDGGIAIIPCDTIYGLCSMYGIGEKPLRFLKGRSETKPFLILATLEQAKELCIEIPKDIENTWPAPLTAILNTKDGKTTAIRVPDDSFLQELLTKLGSPIYSTSVNMSGEPTLLNFSQISKRFEAIVDVVVRGPEIQGLLPSTLIDATSKPYKVLRQGAFDASSLLSS